MSRIAYIGVLAAGAVLTVVALAGPGPEASASGDGRVCAAVWCPKERPGWRAPAPKGDEPPTSSTTTTTKTSTYTKPSTTTSTKTSSTTTTTTSKSTSSTTSTTTSKTTSSTTTTTPLTTTTSKTSTKPPATTRPVPKPPRHQDNRLANTGASTTWLLPLGVLLLTAGVLLLLIDRTRRPSRR